MKIRCLAAAAVALCLPANVGVLRAADDATLLRVFLQDGTSLVSYGEFARVANRVIFSLPSAAAANPALQLVNIAADRVDWTRTNRYAESARAARYAATLAESDYAALSNSVSRALNEVAFAAEPAARLAIVENARKTLADWPQSHYNFKVAEVRQMLGLLDEAIADLRAAAGGTRFDLSLFTVTVPPESAEPLLPPPSAKESIEGLLTAARLSESAAERKSLMDTALAGLDRDAARMPDAWVADTRVSINAALETERRVDRAYQATIRRVTQQAETRARFGDVRGITRVLEGLRKSDEALGRQRPDAVNDAIAAVGVQLAAAQRLRLARDRWVGREPVLRQYRAALTRPLTILRGIDGPLGDIKELSGSSPTTLTFVQREVARALARIERIVPPEEGRPIHALLISAAHLADSAAKMRSEATAAGNLAQAWDASSAAAGALMLEAKAHRDIQAFLHPPQLQ